MAMGIAPASFESRMGSTVMKLKKDMQQATQTYQVLRVRDGLKGLLPWLSSIIPEYRDTLKFRIDSIIKIINTYAYAKTPNRMEHIKKSIPTFDSIVSDLIKAEQTRVAKIPKAEPKPLPIVEPALITPLAPRPIAEPGRILSPVEKTAKKDIAAYLPYIIIGGLGILAAIAISKK